MKYHTTKKQLERDAKIFTAVLIIVYGGSLTAILAGIVSEILAQ
jgi:hypothetical protein